MEEHNGFACSCSPRRAGRPRSDPGWRLRAAEGAGTPAKPRSRVLRVRRRARPYLRRWVLRGRSRVSPPDARASAGSLRLWEHLHPRPQAQVHRRSRRPPVPPRRSSPCRCRRGRSHEGKQVKVGNGYGNCCLVGPDQPLHPPWIPPAVGDLGRDFPRVLLIGALRSLLWVGWVGTPVEHR